MTTYIHTRTVTAEVFWPDVKPWPEGVRVNNSGLDRGAFPSDQHEWHHRWIREGDAIINDTEIVCREVFEREYAEKQFACADCGALRTKAEGGTTFTVCDDCWDRKEDPSDG